MKCFLCSLPYPFDQSFMVRALVAAIIIGIAAPLVGTFIVQRRLSLVGDGFGHVAAAGVGLALWFNWAPHLIAIIATVLAACAIEWIFHTSKNSDTALALIFYSGIAASITFAGRSSQQSQLQQYLFGSLLTVTPNDLMLIGMICGTVSVIVILLRKLLVAISIDESSAIIARVPIHVLHVALMCSIAIIVSASMTVTGLLLISAVMVVPVMSARLISQTFFQTWIASIALGVTGSVLGLIFSRIFDSTPGGTIVLTHITIFILINLLSILLRRYHSREAHHVHESHHFSHH